MAARELLKLLCANGQLELLEDICQRYQSMEQKKSGKFYVTLRYVTPTTDTQLEDIKKFVAHRYGDEQERGLRDGGGRLPGQRLQADRRQRGV